ncbi:minichromosome maintenance protein MCM [archaeon]|nr:minichromosome maintenance protein MCM [archaeon]
MAIDASEQIEKFQDFFDSACKKEIHAQTAKGKTYLIIDFFELTKFDPDLAEQLIEEPEETLRAAEIAVEQFDTGKNFRIRFSNLPKSQTIFIRDIRSIHLSKFIAVEGIIRLSSEVRPQVVIAKFECPSCGNAISIPQLESQFKEPSRCSCGRKGRFRLISKELVDAQRIVIEESPESLEGGAQPKRLQIFLKEDLVEPRMERKTTPGSRIIVSGIVKEIPIPLRTGATSTRYELGMDANSIESVEADFSEIEINPEDEEKIKGLAKDPMIYERLVNSTAPSIFGYDRIKEAIVLQMFGGVRKIRKDHTVGRGDMHILLVGDPGVAKSAMLSFVSHAAPKSRLVSGKGATSAGVTATIVKDEFLRGWALEAGAIVLADRGILILDEMDKMAPEDTSALHEAMEQQRISIAKANIQAVLRAQTSVLAAANPKFGRFDPYTEIPKQIDLPPTLINRFDLIFVMRDIPDRKLDTNIAMQVLRNQSALDMEPDIKREILRKYIAYAKQNIAPVLAEEAMEEIKEFYVGLRSQALALSGGSIKGSIPISARQLEAIVRLAEASARIRLSQKVTKKDVKRALDLLKYSLTQVGMDPETQQFDIDRITTGISASTRNIILQVRDLIYELSAKKGKDNEVNIELELKPAAQQRGINLDKLDEAIEKLKRSGDIFEPRKGAVKRL